MIKPSQVSYRIPFKQDESLMKLKLPVILLTAEERAFNQSRVISMIALSIIGSS